MLGITPGICRPARLALYNRLLSTAVESIRTLFYSPCPVAVDATSAGTGWAALLYPRTDLGYEGEDTSADSSVPASDGVRKQPNRKTAETASLWCRCQSPPPAPNMRVCQAQRRVWVYCSRSVLRMRCESRGLLLHQPRRTRRTSRTDYENQPTSRSPSPLPPDSFSRPSQGCKLLWIIAVTFIRTVAAYLCLRGGSGA